MITPNPTRTSRRVRTGLSRTRRDRSPDRWETWWEINKEPFLSTRDRQARGLAVTSAAGHLLGRGEVAAAVTRIPLERLRAEVIPALLGVLGEDDADVVDSAVLALARIVPADEAQTVFEPIAAARRHPQGSAREAAVLALGVLGSPRARPLLHALLRDSRRGRQELGGTGPVPIRIRAFAALALGMIADADDADMLGAISRDPRAPRDLAGCTVIALGRMPRAAPRIVPLLAPLLEARSIDRVVRALVPIALGRIGAPARSAIPSLVAAVASNRSDNDLVRSSVIALGRLADPPDEKVTGLLQTVIRAHHDRPSRHVALIALGRIVARAVSLEPSAPDLQRARIRFLLEKLTRPTDRQDVAWSGLALGITLHAMARSDMTADGTVLRVLREAFGTERNPSIQGALAIALGLSGTREGSDERLAAMLRTKDGPLRGYLALSLGLSQAAVGPQIHQVIASRALAPSVRLNLARGLALTAESGTVTMLIGLLEKARSTAERAGMAQAIGLVGDGRAISPLVAILEDRHNPGILRGLAAVALGRLGEKTAVPWNTPFTVGMNVHCCPDPLREVIDIL